MRLHLGACPLEFKSRVAKNHLNWNAICWTVTGRACVYEAKDIAVGRIEDNFSSV